MAIGEKFKEYLNYSGIDQKDAAMKLDVSPQQLSMMINGKRSFNQETIENITRLWPDININWLFKEDIGEENKVNEPDMGYIKSHEATGIITEIEEKLKELRQIVAQK